MRNKFIFFFTTLSIFALTVHAQTKKEKAVTDAVESLRKAMIDADKNVLENLTSGNLSYGHSGGAVDDKKTFVEKITSGQSDFVTIELSDQTISISGKTAVVRHALDATTNEKGKPGVVKLKVLLIWQKQKGKWKLLARQAVKI
jgi:ketosteroid isomerase-like protein